MVWAWNLVCGRFISFRNGRKSLTILTFGCPTDKTWLTGLKLRAPLRWLSQLPKLQRPRWRRKEKSKFAGHFSLQFSHERKLKTKFWNLFHEFIQQNISRAVFFTRCHYTWAQFCCKMWGDSLVWNQYSHRVDAEVTFYI